METFGLPGAGTRNIVFYAWSYLFINQTDNKWQDIL